MKAKKKAAVEQKAPRHCDEYIHDFDAPMALRWFLFLNRLPAIDKMLCDKNNVTAKLFATYRGKRVRVTMASRLGDVGITYNFDQEMGYKERVAVEDLHDFASEL